MSKISRNKAKSLSANQQHDLQERKRDERTVRNAYRKQQKDCYYLADDENFSSFATQLQTVKLQLRDVPGDGNCLFRALGDQNDGHVRNHLAHRAETVEYMMKHRDDFEPFVEDDVPFDKHIKNLAKSGTYAGNDSIVAFARQHGLNVVIHQLNAPDWRVSGSDRPGARELHIAYHNGDHYSSVRKYGDKSQEPTNYKSEDTSKLTSAGRKAQHKDRSWSPHGAVATSDAWGGSSCNGSLDDMVIQITDATGCQDSSFISDSLEDNQYDLQATIDFIMVMMQGDHNHDEGSCQDDAPSNGLWSSEGTGSRIFGGGIDGECKTQPNRTAGRGRGSKAANSHVKQQQKKAEKKERQMERHKEKILGIKPTSPDTHEDTPSTVSVPIGQMGALSI